jgi:hypothetical protein
MWRERNDGGFLSAERRVGIFGLEVCQRVSDGTWLWHIHETTKGELWIATSEDELYGTEDAAKVACETHLREKILLPALTLVLPPQSKV